MYSQITVKRPPLAPNLLSPSPSPLASSAPCSPSRCSARRVFVFVCVHSESERGTPCTTMLLVFFFKISALRCNSHIVGFPGGSVVRNPLAVQEPRVRPLDWTAAFPTGGPHSVCTRPWCFSGSSAPHPRTPVRLH